MNLRNRVLNAGTYSSWHIVKHNPDFDNLKVYINILKSYQSMYSGENINDFIQKYYPNAGNYRTLKLLPDLNLLENSYPAPDHYFEYKLRDSIANAISDSDLRHAIEQSMLSKNFVAKQSSKKTFHEGTTLYINPYKILLKVMLKVYDKTQKSYVSKFEVNNIIARIHDVNEIDEAVDIILENRKSPLKINDSDSRFHRTIELISGIRAEKANKNYIFSFNVAKISQHLHDEVQRSIPSEFNINELLLNQPKLSKSDFIKISTSCTRNAYYQQQFRKKLLKEFKHCALCSISNPSLLVASHIKAVALSIKDGRYHEFPDSNNGLLLCANHDLLFDKKMISFTQEGYLVGNTNGVTTEYTDIKKWLNKHRESYISHHYKIYFNNTSNISQVNNNGICIK